MSDITKALLAIKDRISEAESEDIDQQYVFAENLALSAAFSLLVACISDRDPIQGIKSKLDELAGAATLVSDDAELVEEIVASLYRVRSVFSKPLDLPDDDLPF